MRVVIAQPSLEDFYTTPHRLSALGGFSIKSLLENQGHTVSLINFPLITKKARKKPIPVYGNHLRDHLLEEKGPVSYFSRWNRWGPEPEECARIIADHNPQVILLSLFAWAYGEDLFSLARAIKENSSLGVNIPLWVGGAGVSVLPGSFASSPYIDLVLTGEGEVLFNDWTLENLIEFGQKRGDKILSAGRYCSSDDMVPVISPTTGGRNHLQTATVLSRGCPRMCRFCSNHLTQGRILRRISPDRFEDCFNRWLKEDHLSSQQRMTLDLEDDNLLLDKSYFREILDITGDLWQKSGRPGESLMFTAENGMDYDLLDEEYLSLLIQKGFRQFNFSLATANKGLAEREGRFYSPSKLKGHLAYLMKKTIPSVTYFICGLEGDSVASLAEALGSMAELPTQIGISLFYTVPGLPGFEGVDFFKNKPSGLARGSMAYPWTGSMTTVQMLTAFRLSRFLNLCRFDHSGQHDELKRKIKGEKLLYTYDRQGKIIPVPNQDRELVTSVLS